MTGTAVRYWIHGLLGPDLGQVASLIATFWVAFWISLFLILGVLPIAHPIALSTILPLGETIENGIGAAFLIAVGGLFIWLSRGARRLSYAGFGFDLP